MASVDECRQALQNLAARLERHAGTPGRVDLDRTLACRITDLDTAFHGRLEDGRLIDLMEGDDPKAKIALSISSDDLVALVHGQLDITQAVGSRRVSIKANPFDLMKLRKLL